MRHHVNKRGSAHSFNSHTRRTKMANVSTGPMRGGWRL